MLPIYLLILYFTAGAIGTWLYTKRKETADRKEIWTKYFLFLFLTMTLSTFLLIQWNTYLIAIVFIILMGLSEIIRLSQKLPHLVLILSVIVYLLMGYCFWSFQVNYPPAFILIIFVLIVTLDGFSQLSGQLFGSIKFLPKLSPNKTLEGYTGGIIITLLTSFLLFEGLKQLSLTVVVISGGICGDLSASWLKRKAGIKDFSNLIPGHGGILDRYDSFIMAGAFAFMYIKILDLRS